MKLVCMDRARIGIKVERVEERSRGLKWPISGHSHSEAAAKCCYLCFEAHLILGRHQYANIELPVGGIDNWG